MLDFDKCNNTTCPQRYKCYRFQAPRAEIDWYCSPNWTMIDGEFSCVSYLGMPIRSNKSNLLCEILKRRK